MKLAPILAIMAVTATPALADSAGDLLDQLSKLHQTKFEALQGTLFLERFQTDENNPTFVAYIEGRKYDARLDDGRGATETAIKCPKDNPFDPKPEMGCKVNFDGQYLVKGDGGRIEVSLILWNIKFSH